MISTAGIILNTLPFRENDQIVTILSREHGKLSAFARGAKNSKKRFMGGLDLFDLAMFELEEPRGRSALFKLQSSSQKKTWLSLRKSLVKLSLASLALEITSHFSVEGDEESGVFFYDLNDLLGTLEGTNNVAKSSTALILFIARILYASGVDPLSNPIFPAHLKEWWGTMLETEELITPPTKEYILESITQLTSSIEDKLAHDLKTKNDVLLFVSKTENRKQSSETDF